jgi:hypothetical protein
MNCRKLKHLINLEYNLKVKIENTFFIDSDNLENPFHIQPKLRNEISSNVLNADRSVEKLGKSNIISDNDVIIREKGSNSEVELSPKNKTPEVNALAEFPFDPSKSTNLDDIITEDGKESNINRRANLVGQSSKDSFFNGFFIREEINKKEFEALKARNDSLIRVLKDRKINNRY